MQKMLQDPLGNFNLVARSCSDIPDVDGDKLAGTFVLYNWAMVLNNNMNFFENDELYNFWIYTEVKKINKPKFQGTLDMSAMVGGSIPKYGAKSFLITHETLASSGDMNLTFKSSGDLKLVAIRVKADGSSDVNKNFVMKSNDTAYELTDEDRAGSLFVTLANTTNTKIDITELQLNIRFERNATTNIVTDHKTGLEWQDETNTWLDSWYGAKRHCDALTLGNYNDWRVPTYDELIHILDLDGEDTYRYEIFEHLGPVGYWSLELNGGVFPSSESAKVVNFGLATWIWINTSSRMNTRCVRTK